VVAFFGWIGAPGGARADGIQKWQTPDGKLFFGDYPPPGSTLLGSTETMGTIGGGDVDTVSTDESESGAPKPRFDPPPNLSDSPVDAGVSLAKRDRLYFDTYSQRGLSPSELEIVERNLNAVRNDVGRELRVDPDARFQVVLTEPDVFHRYSGTQEQVSGLFDGKIHLPIPAGIAESELQGTLWHEYSHAVIFSRIGNRCPVWLNEGIAVHQQSKIDPARRQRLRQLLGPDGKLPYDWAQLDATLHSRTASHPAQDAAYQQALAIVDYLYDRYSSRRVNELIDRIGESGDVATALRETMHVSLEELDRAVVEHLKSG
jgi:hypothetical protein